MERISLGLSKEWKASFNMMFKQYRIIFLTMLIFAISLPTSVNAKGMEQKDIGTKGYKKADILLVYNNAPSNKEKANLEIIVKQLTYLQQSVVFATVSESQKIISNYDNIICFNLSKDSDEFYTELAKQNKNVFVLGGENIATYTEKKGYPVTAVYQRNLVADISYNFQQDKQYKALLHLQKTTLLYGSFQHQNGEIIADGKQTGLYSGFDKFVYTPVHDLSDNLIWTSFTKEIALWIWPYKGDPHPCAQYIVLDKVYPFTPPDKLQKIVDYLILNKLPFVISVMPIYENGDYPSMKRFCEVLRYAQANNGAIIMHSPNIIKDGENVTQLWKYLTIATEAYTNQGIYPIGLEAPDRFIFENSRIDLLKRYSTVFFYSENREPVINLKVKYNTIFKDGHTIVGSAIGLNEIGNSQIKVYSAAQYLNVWDDFGFLEKQIDGCVNSEIPLRSLWDMNHSVYVDNLYLHTVMSQVYLNNKKVSLEYKPFKYKKYTYKPNIFIRIAANLGGLNKKLKAIAAIASVMFIIFIISARRLNKRKFLIPKDRRSLK